MTNPPFYNSIDEYNIRRYRMKFLVKVWKFSITIDLFDLDTSDKNIAFKVTIAWK
ncbi:hypothetical protein LCGC14_1773320 [marine sediment metagenome]|uniref:Uncharacterized protein n=1 Tax=marine sediment metagenome TaxID=412755 RepID=A0A0F9JCI2_9ZZZZ